MARAKRKPNEVRSEAQDPGPKGRLRLSFWMLLAIFTEGGEGTAHPALGVEQTCSPKFPNPLGAGLRAGATGEELRPGRTPLA
ncbi:hypothetical protein EES41_35770 [Streptomyces sp. ADI95-16]|uniref:hypothetical protein n=1 Tax=Streptomyces sp. ADI95-16 TaxID=1522758 RepID=UPI000F3AA4DD|nr:hypothetical protein [Streptomyces sp. ADI95-16]AYV32115.1 hypothetical protein EES41_35770 [Streptomyces sp. ADI95-16]